jgi:diadenosine tetraphosphate (Ap4A) HIT family hydrolase
MTDFRLDPRLEASSAWLHDLPVSQARLQLDRRWPWIVLIPRGPDLVELDDLALEDRRRLLDELAAAGRAVRALGEELGFGVEKLNLGALGNIVSQLHVHVVGRRPGDPAWPGPVWGFGPPEPYHAGETERACNIALRALTA